MDTKMPPGSCSTSTRSWRTCSYQASVRTTTWRASGLQWRSAGAKRPAEQLNEGRDGQKPRSAALDWRSPTTVAFTGPEQRSRRTHDDARARRECRSTALVRVALCRHALEERVAEDTIRLGG